MEVVEIADILKDIDKKILERVAERMKGEKLKTALNV